MERLKKQYQDEGRTSLVFSVRGPIPIQMDDSMSSWGSGSSVLDLIFPQPETVTEIRFRNWYTARMSLLVRFDDSAQAPPKKEHLAWAAAATLSLARLRGVESTEGIKIGKNVSSARSATEWTISLQSKVLMPDPHTESGSQDMIIIPASESLVSLHDVTALRFILRQPSPNWKTFNIEEIKVFRDALIKPRTSSSSSKSVDSGVESSASSTSKSTNSKLSEPKDEDDILDQLARQTTIALKGGRANLDDESTSSSESSVPYPLVPMTYDVMNLSF